MTSSYRLAASAFAAALMPAAAVLAQTLPPGPPVAITMVTQLSPTIPQYTKVDIPMLREGIPDKSGGRIKVTLASWPERALTGPELLRVIRRVRSTSARRRCRRWPATCRCWKCRTSPASTPRMRNRAR